MFANALRPLFLIALLNFVPTAAGAATSTDQASRFIQTLADQAIEVLRSNEAGLADRQARFRTLLKDRFAVRTIGRFVLGRHWRRATPEQQRQYLELFADWIVKTYAVRFGGYTDERLTITGTRVNPGDQDIFVGTEIAKPDSSVIFNANWRVRRINGSYRIIDIEVEGLSMAVAQRAEFNSVARRKGIDGLLDVLRTRIDDIDRNGS